MSTGVKTEQLYALSRLVEELSGVPIPANKALVGYNSFSHEAGIHTHGILAHTLTYEPLQPSTLGRQRQMILGKHSGKAAVVEKLKERKAVPTDAQLAAGEAHTKDAAQAFLREYRGFFEHPGLSDVEFWAMVDRLGILTEKT
jgi:isopropylmalate/homocitrate/citramalate synthase